jgi:hypothetical protein
MAKITIAQPALVSLIALAVEPYRFETFGYLLVSTKGKDYRVDAALSYQLVKRCGYYLIEDTIKAERAYKWTSEITQVMDGFHSHTYSSRQKLDATPTKTDIKDMTIGHFDIIVAIQKTRRKYITKWYEKGQGLTASINGYKFLIRCWKKIESKKFQELKLRIRVKQS